MLKIDVKYNKEIGDYINKRIPILDVLKLCGVKMVKSGNTWRSLCPMPDHDDKNTTSFTVIENGNNFVYCFGCARAWYPLNFYREYENKTWHEAIEELAKAFSVDLTPFRRDATDEEKLILHAYQINAAVAEWLQDQIKYHADANRYLMSRYDRATMEKWQLGYCHQGSALMEFLYKKCKFEYQALQKLDIRPSVFHDRITYPIFDMYGNIVGFSNRVWAASKAEEEQKYQADKAKGAFKKFINTGGNSILFKHKANHMQGLHLARKAIRKAKGTVIVVEGCSDVMIMHKYGFENCVGSLSTAFNKHSLETLSSIAVEHVIFCLDGDLPGQKRTLELLSAQKKLAHELPETSRQIRYSAIALPNGLDPDEFLEKGERNRVALKNMLAQPLLLPEFYVHHHAQIHSAPKTITDKIDYIFNVRKTLMPVLSGAEIRIISESLKSKFGITSAEFEEYNQILHYNKTINKTYSIEEKILAWLVQDKQFRSIFLNTDFSPDMFTDGNIALFRVIWEISNGKIASKAKALDEFNEKQLNVDLIIQRLRNLRWLSYFQSDKRVREILLQPLVDTKGLLQEFKEHVKKRKIKLLNSALNSMMANYSSADLLKFIRNEILSLEG